MQSSLNIYTPVDRMTADGVFSRGRRKCKPILSSHQRNGTN